MNSLGGQGTAPKGRSASRCLSLALLAAGLAVAIARPSVAATKEESSQARSHFQKGQRHYDLHEFAEALAEFKDAYRVVPDAVLLYNIAQCHYKLGQKRDAVGFYRQFLRKRPEAANRAEVEARISELEGELEKDAKAPPPMAAKPTPPKPIARNERVETAPEAPPANITPPPSLLPSPPLDPAPVPTRDEGLQANTTSATSREPSPFYTRWWFWTAAAVVVAAGVGVGIAASGRTEVGNCQDLGAACLRIGE